MSPSFLNPWNKFKYYYAIKAIFIITSMAGTSPCIVCTVAGWNLNKSFTSTMDLLKILSNCFELKMNEITSSWLNTWYFWSPRDYFNIFVIIHVFKLPSLVTKALWIPLQKGSNVWATVLIFEKLIISTLNFYLFIIMIMVIIKGILFGREGPHKLSLFRKRHQINSSYVLE